MSHTTPPRRVMVCLIVLAVVTMAFSPEMALASVESSLMAVKMRLTGVVLPLLSVIGLAFAAVSFYTGNPQAKQHIIYAILGSAFGFGAQAIIDFIAQTVN